MDDDPRLREAFARQELLAGVCAAARRAGEAIEAVARDASHAGWKKADDSPLTHADLAADAIVVDALRALDPGTLVISEETPCTHEALPARFWLVDPLDGTREFLARNGEYTVNVALVEDGQPVLGVVHAPARGVTYSASRGAGGNAVRAGAGGVAQTICARAGGALRVVASRSHPSRSLAAFLAALPPHEVVAMGSSLKLCAVAEGGAQLYPRLGPTSWWDTAAAHAIVLAAGATVLRLDGTPLRYDGTDLRNPPFVCTSLSYEFWSAAARAVA